MTDQFEDIRSRVYQADRIDYVQTIRNCDRSQENARPDMEWLIYEVERLRREAEEILAAHAAHSSTTTTWG
jgi:hypothetical protein